MDFRDDLEMLLEMYFRQDNNLFSDIREALSQLEKLDIAQLPETPFAVHKGVPVHPLYKYLAHALSDWMATSVFPRKLEYVPVSLQNQLLNEKSQLWTETITTQLGALQRLMQRVKLNLQVQDSVLSKLIDENIWVVVRSSYLVEGEPVIAAYDRVSQGDLFLLNNVILEESQAYDQHVDSKRLKESFPLCPLPHHKQPMHIVHQVMEVLGMEGIKALMGFHSTTGSITNVLSPSWSTLLESFLVSNNANVAGSKLTTGGRALAKHVHRSSSGWWGHFSDKTKNKLALDVITHLMQNACWLNVHHMPPDSAVFEIRVAEGYGARWTSDGKKFRGFLEPMMEGGHEIKWKH